MNQHSVTKQELIKQLAVDPDMGLTTEEAKKRLSADGENRLKEKKKKSIVVRFLEQFKDAMVIILIIAAIISLVTSIIEHEGLAEPIIIFAIVCLNAVMGVMQESKAEKALEALKNMSSPHARVIRDGREQKIDASQLVRGDIILLEAGDFIPADARLIDCASLKCEEAPLTGESVPVEKDAEAVVNENSPLGDRINMVYSGCAVSYGRAKAVITDTGMRTEMGKIASLLNNEPDATTPLQKKLAKLGGQLGILAIGICIVIFIIGLISKKPVLEIFMIAVSLAVAAIPEGLPAIVTVVLALGVQRMVKRNAIIKNLPAVETLGSASVICSDKTGTLTMNRMTLCRVWTEKDGIVELTPEISASVEETLLLGALCCDGTVNEVDGKEVLIGDPTETAIVRAAKQYGMTKDILAAKFPRIMELPFDSDRKLMTTVHSMNGKYYAVTKGAYDVIESRVEKDLSSAREATRMMSEQALRVLAVAIKELQELPEAPTQEALEYGLTLIGLVGMIDPARPEAKQAVSVCREAGIKPVMITGDHIVTASAIARELGILIDGDDAITGAELAAMTEEQLNERVRNISVYARVSPEDKIRIVKAWQKQGEVVAMTGDGVNDAPALKAADIGCAMGITGTDVAKGAADVTLTDDNFATIVEAVKEGRGIYENIKRVVGFLLGTNIGEIIVVFLSMLLWQESPLLSMQLLWINVVTDTLPAMALGVEPVKQGIMRFKPRKQSESLFANGYGVQIALQGVMFGLLSLAAFAIGLNTNIETARTMAFLTLAFSQTIHAFNMRSNESIFKIGVFGNKYLNLASLASIILVCAVSFIPALQSLFALTFLNGWQYLVVAAFTVTPIVVLEIAKALKIIKD